MLKLKCVNSVLLTILIFFTYKLITTLNEYNDIAIRSHNGVKSSVEIDDKRTIRLAVGILSKLSAIHRRNSIRLTWLKICHERPKEVFCRFFTDALDSKNKSDLIEEDNEYKDLVHMPFKGKLNSSFLKKYLWLERVSIDSIKGQ